MYNRIQYFIVIIFSSNSSNKLNCFCIVPSLDLCRLSNCITFEPYVCTSVSSGLHLTKTDIKIRSTFTAHKTMMAVNEVRLVVGLLFVHCVP